MSKKNSEQNSGIWGTFPDKQSQLLNFLSAKNDELQDCNPKVSILKKDNSTMLYLQFTIPIIKKRTQKKCGEYFNEAGIIQAAIKAKKISNLLSLIASEKFAVSDFDTWYNTEILEIGEKIKLLTYREIFSKIESEYYKGTHHNNKTVKRSKDIPSFVSSYNRQYGGFFKKFPDWDKVPSWGEIWKVWESCKQGTKDFKDMKITVTAIVKHMPNCDDLMKKVAKIDSTQTEFKEKQFIGLDEFLTWWQSAYDGIPTVRASNHRKARESWLWVAAVNVVYGLRPSEIAAALNLTQPFTKDGETVYALTDEVRNPEALLVIGDFTYFGASTKTGMRVIAPIPDKALWDKLQIRNPMLPKYTPKPGSKPETIVNGFDNAYGQRLIGYKCPISQKYAFRHLYNFLCKLHGLPQEIRARNMGHTTTANLIYEKRFDFKADVALAKLGKSN